MQLVAILLTMLLLPLLSCGGHDTDKIQIVASILPQKYFVERIGGSFVEVEVMVQPGMNPTTFEPLPGQLFRLDRADIYMKSGVPFEDIWLPRIMQNHPKITFIDTLRGIRLYPIDSINDIIVHNSTHEDSIIDNEVPYSGHRHSKDRLDPHVWLSPKLVKVQARNICDALCAYDPAHAGVYQDNLRDFHRDLDALSTEIQEVFNKLEEKYFLVFHPAWGYFAREFRLVQLAIESEGKEPGPRELMQITEYARKHGIRVIFVQSQFNADIAHAVAEQIGAVVLAIDPLAENYIENLRQVARAISGHLAGGAGL